MTDGFRPPGISSLAELDVAEDSYEQDVVVIQGVVSPSAQGGWPGKNENYEIHCFEFAAWHRDGQPVIQRELTILRPVPPEADYLDDFPEHSIQRLSVLLSTDGTRAVFDQALSLDSADDALAAVAVELQKTVTFATERFGQLVLDRSIDWFEGQAEWNGEAVRVTFPLDDDEENEPSDQALEVAEQLWTNQQSWKQRIEHYAVKELLDLKNDTWLDEGESPFSPEQFKARMVLTSISIEPDGAFEFWFEDGDLFWGHAIMVSGDRKDGPNDAGIHG